MHKARLLIINGYGASEEYMRPLARHLECPVIILSLLHGVSLREECTRVNAVIERESPTAILGFSTGCIIASACAVPPECRLIFVNPPDISSRQTLCSLIRYLVKDTAYPLACMDVIWKIAQSTIGPIKMARLYHWLHGARVNEPPATEIARIVTARSLRDMLTTIDECLLKPGIRPMMRVAATRRRLDILVGEHDPYTHVAHALFEAGSEVRLHRVADADHHMLYYLAAMCAEKIKTIVYSRSYHIFGDK